MPKESKKSDKPKKPLSAFMCFSNANRDKVKSAHPGVAFGEVGKKLGEMWQAASGDEKKKFEAEAAADKIRYQRDMDKYRQEHPNSEDEGKGGKKKKERKKKDPNAPKRPMTAFFLFMNDSRERTKKEHPEMKLTEVSKYLSEQWGKMSDEAKKKYVDQAASAKERYAKEVAAGGGTVKAAAPKKKKEKPAAKEESEEASGSGEEDGSGGSDEEGSDE